MKRCWAALAATVAVASLSAASVPASAIAGGSGEGARQTVTIHSYTYTVPAMVKAGTRIRVVNRDAFEHTVTSDGDEAFNVLVEGDSSTHFTAPDKPGRYVFHCFFHAGMSGVLIVGPPGTHDG